MVPEDALGRALRAAGRELAYPPTPELAGAVAWRLEAGGAARRRPPFPRMALWSRRRLLVVAAIGLLAALALAFGVRFVLGAAEVRVHPGVSPSGPPLGPGRLGEPIPVEEVSEAVGFEVALPTGPAPDEAYVVTTDGLDDAALLAWAPGPDYPAIGGAPWGLVLLELTEDDVVVVKDLQEFGDFREVRVGGRRAFWIDAPHELTVITADGPETFSVRGNVLIWTKDDVTFRLETSLPLREARALAETIG
jgi:hypothetical protein